jgi:hypothetical protein
MKFKEAKFKVAYQNKLGKTLVTGHLSKYWEEAANIFIKTNLNLTSDGWIEEAKENVKNHGFDPVDYSHFAFTTVNGAVNTFTEYAMTKGSHPDGRMTTEEVSRLLIWFLARYKQIELENISKKLDID